MGMNRLCMVLAALCLCALVAGAEGDFRTQVEQDWLFQEHWRNSPPLGPEADAAGGCDGVIDGKWGFHTGFAQDPWWQVDLGAVRAVSHACVYNRCDAASRARGFSLLLSDDGSTWRKAYQHGEEDFYGHADGKPLVVPLNTRTRYVRIAFRGPAHAHLDEVQVFDSAGGENLALRAQATQVSTSQWSTYSLPRPEVPVTPRRVSEIIGRARSLGADSAALDSLARQLDEGYDGDKLLGCYFAARWLQREALLARPELDFGSILLTKRAPGSFSHMSDQYYGWWSRPGGGIFRIDGFRDGAPHETSLTTAFTDAGSFLRPCLSYGGRRVLFAWCRHYPELAAEPDKLNKDNVPEDAFYHVFEMNVDGSGLRQLTHGKYDDFDARYLPDGRIVFLSTRRGQAVQAGMVSAAQSCATKDCPDSYVRCGGGPERPVAVYTLHRMDADGGDMVALSPFEMFEWTPVVGHDGTVVYSRWDYVDRDNMPYMGLWKMRPDGTNAQLVYGNYTRSPHCTFEPQPIPGSHKYVFTASAHHAQTMGSLVVLDPHAGLEGEAPLERLTPEVCFPEIEGWPSTFFATPWPLSERLYLVTWGRQDNAVQGSQRPVNGMALYLFDAEGDMELLYTDPDISVESPVPLREQPKPPVIADTAQWARSEGGSFFVKDVYAGLRETPRGSIDRLRVVAVPAKTQPTMNTPSIGLTNDDPGKCVLGSVPVEEDGSVFFQAPAGVTVFFQLLDAEGRAVQTMRSATHVQPGQALGCVGCHEPREAAPPLARSMAALHEPRRLTLPPSGAWPYRFEDLVQPALDRECVTCHQPGGDAAMDLRAEHAYEALTQFGSPNLGDQVRAAYRDGVSTEGKGLSLTSLLGASLEDHARHGVEGFSRDTMQRLYLWMDTYAQRAGAFSPEQEAELVNLRARWADLFVPREADLVARSTP